jgi:DNA-binding NtrC family response regulator
MSKNPPLRVLIVDDEKTLRVSLALALREDGYEVDEAETGAEALAKVVAEPPHVLLLDLRLPDEDGIEVFKKIRARTRDPVVIMMTAYGVVEAAFEAVRLGAYYYISKPFSLDRMKELIANAVENVALRREAESIRQIKLGERDSDKFLLGRTEKMEDVYQIITKVAESKSSTVLIQGECGTGKELVAKAIHHASVGRAQPFMVINCGSLPANLLESELFGHEAGAFTDARKRKLGLMELAQNGSLFLDEIGELPLPLQTSLLRAIETKTFKRVGGVQDIQVNTRIIAATNRDLRREVAMGRFRKDLFFRLNVVPIVLPPLRERREDILLLASHFIDHFNKELTKNIRGFSPSARRRLVEYDWPGNIRELRNVLERAVLLESEEIILLEHLPLEISAGAAEGMSPDPTENVAAFAPGPLDEIEKRHILHTLQWTSGNKTRAAKILGISRQTLREKLKSYGIQESEDAAAEAGGQIPIGR